jgi:hypothetical protein
MRAAPYGPCWPSSCEISGWEVVCDCCGGHTLGMHCFFLEEKGYTFSFVRDLVLRLKNDRHEDAMRAIRSENGSEFKNSRFETFYMTWVLNISF